jgi:hypothetical protein
LALFDLEGNVVDSDGAGVSLGQALYFDHSLIPDKTNTVVIEGRAQPDPDERVNHHSK